MTTFDPTKLKELVKEIYPPESAEGSVFEKLLGSSAWVDGENNIDNATFVRFKYVISLARILDDSALIKAVCHEGPALTTLQMLVAKFNVAGDSGPAPFPPADVLGGPDKLKRLKFVVLFLDLVQCDEALTSIIVADKSLCSLQGFVSKFLRINDIKAYLAPGPAVDPGSKRIKFLVDMANLFDCHEVLVARLAQDVKLLSIRDIAANYSREKLTEMASYKWSPDDPIVAPIVKKLFAKLWAKQKSAILQRMAGAGELSAPAVESTVWPQVSKFFQDHSDFDIASTSLLPLVNGLQEPKVKEQLLNLQRLQALTTSPESVKRLLAKGIKSAYQISCIPAKQFAQVIQVGEDEARQIHSEAMKIRMRHETTAVRVLDTIRGRGLRVLDNPIDKTPSPVASDLQGLVNLKTLFGSLDFTDFKDRPSILSPAAYLVELLQFLSVNNIMRKDTSHGGQVSESESVSALDLLLRRRPDIAHLALTTANTDTIIPYIDLVNEIMESFVVHLRYYCTKGKIQLDGHNFLQGSVVHPLATPVNVNYAAYKIISEAVHPFILPYHRPLDEIRQALLFLGTSRHELLEVVHSLEAGSKVDRTREVDAECLGLGELEYTILVKEGFDPKSKPIQTSIHVGWGYKTQTDMLGPKAGLRNIHSEFLSRAGISFIDLVALLKTRFINPHQLHGWEVSLLGPAETYRSLRSHVDPLIEPPAKRYEFVMDLLRDNLESIGPNSDKASKKPTEAELEVWVLENFDRIGQLIIIEKGEKLEQLSGNQLDANAFDRMQRFLRLWKVLGWTMKDVDRALLALDGLATEDDSDRKVNRSARKPVEITPRVIEQLCAIQKLLSVTKQPLVRLTSFWMDIGTAGDMELYSEIFLRTNISVLHPVFQPDEHERVLPDPKGNLQTHKTGLMAAMKMKSAEEFSALLEVSGKTTADTLDLATISSLHRHSLLAVVLGLNIQDLVNLKKCHLFECDPFYSPSNTLQTLNLWKTIQSVGITTDELAYLVNKVQPALILGPTKVDILQLSKAVHDGISAIEREHGTATISRTEEMASLLQYLEENLGLLFSPSDAKVALDLVKGGTKYSAKCSQQLEDISAETLPTKLKYNHDILSLEITGILTTEEEDQTRKSFFNKPALLSALEAIKKQTQAPFGQALATIIPTERLSDARQTLYAGDDSTSALKKANFLHEQLRRYLRGVLGDKLFIETLAASSKLPMETVSILLRELRIDGSRLSASKFFQDTTDDTTTQTDNCWADILFPPTTDMYTFTFGPATTVEVKTTKGSGSAKLCLVLNDECHEVLLDNESQDGSAARWSSKEIELVGGHSYSFKAPPSLILLEWKTTRSTRPEIPSTAIIPAWKTLEMAKVMEPLLRRAMIINKLELGAQEVDYFFGSGEGEFRIVVDRFKLEDMRRLALYVNFRKSLAPNSESSSLINFFRWAAFTESDQFSANIGTKLAEVTGWKPNQIKQLVALVSKGVWPSSNLITTELLVNLQRLHTFYEKTGVDIQPLLALATWNESWDKWLESAASLRQSLRAKFDLEDWAKAVKPMSDDIRRRSRDAFIAFLLSEPDLKAPPANIHDADSLFEFFLIDVQMSACLETSRVRQAISTVQLFVQRCLLRLEEGKPLIDRKRWSTMELQPLHTARRNVFLFPENYLHPSLRDNKSPLFKEFESELMQRELTDQNVADLMKNYLDKLVEVADLEVNGLSYDHHRNSTHVIASTRSSPPGSYYRRYDGSTREWTAWEKIPVEIPRYISGSTEGVHIMPFVLDGHLIIAFPSFEPDTPDKTASKVKMTKDGENWIASEPGPNTTGTEVDQGVKIRMCWVEYRDGKWGPKHFSTRSLPHKPGHMNNVHQYSFLTHFSYENGNSTVSVRIHAYHPKSSSDSSFGGFNYIGGTFVPDSDAQTLRPAVDAFTGFLLNSFHYRVVDRMNTISSTQFATWGSAYSPGSNRPYVQYPTVDLAKLPDYKATGTICIYSIPQALYHGFIRSVAATVGETQNVEEIFKYYSKSVSDEQVPAAFGQSETGVYNESKASYSLYNWELAFHIPMTIAERLRVGKEFKKALDMLHYIFNPFEKEAANQTSTGPERYWKFKPFQKLLENPRDMGDVLANLEPGMDNASIEAWRDNPFDPHVIARSRPVAYMKWVVMLYLKILLEYGDYYFRQNSMESIPRAAQIYVLAAHLFGPKPEARPEPGKVVPKSYHELKENLDPFDNAIVQMELCFPFSNQSVDAIVSAIPNDFHLPNIFGFASSHYFYIPANPELRKLRDTIDDRLFKLRHCQDIDGVIRRLPLFEPPLDPQLLVKAASQGISVSTLLTDLNTPPSNYRFPALLHKALEAATQVSLLGGAYLSIRATHDTEALSRLRSTHECRMHDLNLLVLNGRLDEANKALDCLRLERKNQVQRLKYLLQLTGDDLSRIPAEDADFQEIAHSLSDSIGSSTYEKAQIALAITSSVTQGTCAVAQAVIAYFAALPDTDVNLSPMGMGTTVKWGPKNLAMMASGEAQAALTAAGAISKGSQVAGMQASFERQVQSYRQEANATGLQIKYIDQQVLTQQIRIRTSEQEIKNQQVAVEQSKETDIFLRSKYTNTELYSWMESELKTLYYRCYTMALEQARSAENAYHFERPLEKNRKFIEFGHWDTSHDGLLSGERLCSDLRRLQSAYQAQKGHDYEISKHVSLRQLCPLAIFELRQNGVCNFQLPEILFDMDFPGHYNRRIKSVSITVPCIVGPYTSVSGTLRLLGHKYRLSPSSEQPYNSSVDATEPDDRFAVAKVPIDAIAVSSAHMDPGVFELSFHDERYMPFEGAGAISNWEFRLPSAFRHFDYDSITDVLLHIQYTSVEGGMKLKTAAESSMMETLKTIKERAQDGGFWTVLDIRNDFPDEWNRAVTGKDRAVTLTRLKERLPVYTKNLPAISAVEVVILSTKNVGSLELSAKDGDSVEWPGKDTGSDKKKPGRLGMLFRYDMKGADLKMEAWKMTLGKAPSESDSMCILIHYVCK